MMICPKCGCEIERKEYDAEKGMSEMEAPEGMIEIKEIDVPADKQAEIRKRLAEIGKLLASVED